VRKAAAPKASLSERSEQCTSSEQTRFWPASDDEVGGLHGAIRARDVRAADLQESRRNALWPELAMSRVVSSDSTKTAASGEHRSERKRAIRYSERKRAEQSNLGRLGPCPGPVSR
jgi:hypothetical protein